MNSEEYNLLKEIEKLPEKLVDVEMLAPFLSDRTLLYGYTCDRDTWHVYIKDKKIHKVIYKYKEKPVEYPIESNYDYIPNKRLYPETCDFLFCKLLIKLGYDLPFTTWNNEREEKRYYGKILDEETILKVEIIKGIKGMWFQDFEGDCFEILREEPFVYFIKPTEKVIERFGSKREYSVDKNNVWVKE